MVARGKRKGSLFIAHGKIDALHASEGHESAISDSLKLDPKSKKVSFTGHGGDVAQQGLITHFDGGEATGGDPGAHAGAKAECTARKNHELLFYSSQS